jgi:CRISPR-associated protein Csb2
LRVAGPGITDALLDCRHEWPTRAQAPLASYSNRAEHTPTTPVTEAFTALLVKRLERTRLDLRFAGVVCAALRSAVLSLAGDDAPSTLHGHGDSAHTAYLALGDVGRPHATGLIAGVALAVSRGLDPGTQRACMQAFGAVEVLKLGPGMRSLSLLDDLGGSVALRPERWARPARSFATVTPVILDRFPRGARTEEDELVTSLVNAGFTEQLVRVEVLAGPAVRGGVLVSDLQGEIPPGRRVHARIEFAKPVRGPLVAGRGRFRGIGLFLPSA